jgi:hypothetical protein
VERGLRMIGRMKVGEIFRHICFTIAVQFYMIAIIDLLRRPNGALTKSNFAGKAVD